MLPPFTLRPLEPRDLPAALGIQAECYPAFLREDAAAFASRLAVTESACLAAVREETLVAYCLAHGWAREAPPPVGAVLPADAASEVLYIHDLAVSAAGRGSGIGARLVAEAFRLAAREGLRTAELIAVEGAAPFWRRQGFVEAQTNPALAAKVAGYGPQARWMRRPIIHG